MKLKFWRHTIAFFAAFLLLFTTKINAVDHVTIWKFQSIDTMKYSRDTSREKVKDLSFDRVIDQQVSNIAKAGATHVAIATPYDDEFLPFLKRWVAAARKYKLSVWFRGNWSGWENWFDYPKITRAEHILKTRAFILAHPEIFEDGDVFSGCPECENGGPGDPRFTRDIPEYRKFLIDEYKATKAAFTQIGKSVASNYFSMNGDVAKLIMDKETTAGLDGIVTIDHYVSSPKRLANDIKEISEQSGGQVVLGEFGAPIPDIHGEMTDTEQANYLAQTMRELLVVPELVGLSYWTNTGGSTALWTGDGNAKSAVSVLTKYFHPQIMSGRLVNTLGIPIAGAMVIGEDSRTISDTTGRFVLPYIAERTRVQIEKTNYKNIVLEASTQLNNNALILEKTHYSWLENVFIFLKTLLKT